MLWLALIWLGLIALWGASDRWDLAGVGRRMVQTVHLRHRTEGPQPLD